MKRSQWIILVVIIAAITAFFIFDLGQYLHLSYLQENLDTFKDYHQQNPLLTAGIYFIIYVLVTALSLPGAAIMTLAGGALFGLLLGTVLVSFASTIGATLAFLVSRFFLRDSVEKRFSGMYQKINQGIEKDGGFYLFTMRLVPAFPFFAVNLLMGITKLKTTTFYWVSQLGMLAGTLVYVNAGRALANITSLKDVASPTLILSFALLGVFPWIARYLLRIIRPETTSSN
jgi:uncharacterized membrane protein YdjX (TVP38/TMEM64 family)